jgi:hypothetical protein
MHALVRFLKLQEGRPMSLHQDALMRSHQSEKAVECGNTSSY